MAHAKDRDKLEDKFGQYPDEPPAKSTPDTAAADTEAAEQDTLKARALEQATPRDLQHEIERRRFAALQNCTLAELEATLAAKKAQR